MLCLPSRQHRLEPSPSIHVGQQDQVGEEDPMSKPTSRPTQRHNPLLTRSHMAIISGCHGSSSSRAMSVPQMSVRTGKGFKDQEGEARAHLREEHCAVGTPALTEDDGLDKCIYSCKTQSFLARSPTCSQCPAPEARWAGWAGGGGKGRDPGAEGGGTRYKSHPGCFL